MIFRPSMNWNFPTSNFLGRSDKFRLVEESMNIKLFEEQYRDDLIFMVLQAKDARLCGF